MKKSELIATVLVNSGISLSLPDARELVRKTFEQEFTDRKFDDWNRDLNPKVAQSLLETIGIKNNLNVKMFILDLEKF